MAHRTARYGLILLFVGMAGVRVSAADCGYAEAIRSHWTRTRDQILTIAAAVPEDKYDFRPVKEVRSFREMLMHMVTDTYTHIGYAGGVSREESERLTEKYKTLKTREEFLKALRESYDYGDKILAELNDQNATEMVSAMRGERMTRVAAALDAFSDIVDHYGNLVVYLRLNGIVPPTTATRDQQRQQQRPQQPQTEEHRH